METKEFLTTNGYTVMVDAEDFDKVSQYSWNHSSKHVRTSVRNGDKIEALLLHRFIIGAPDDALVDHKNLNVLDNRKENIRLATREQNEWNKPKQKTWFGKPCTSKYRGVCWDWRIGKWLAQIGH